jgi:hypothetical protein
MFFYFRRKIWRKIEFLTANTASLGNQKSEHHIAFQEKNGLCLI